MKTIYEARDLINVNKGNKVTIKVSGIRNKSEMLDGVITECYRNVFIVDTGFNKRSFTYTDVLIGNILVNFK